MTEIKKFKLKGDGPCIMVRTDYSRLKDPGISSHQPILDPCFNSPPNATRVTLNRLQRQIYGQMVKQNIKLYGIQNKLPSSQWLK